MSSSTDHALRLHARARVCVCASMHLPRAPVCVCVCAPVCVSTSMCVREKDLFLACCMRAVQYLLPVTPTCQRASTVCVCVCVCVVRVCVQADYTTYSQQAISQGVDPDTAISHFRSVTCNGKPDNDVSRSHLEVWLVLQSYRFIHACCVQLSSHA